jgi:hypothetical protein
MSASERPAAMSAGTTAEGAHDDDIYPDDARAIATVAMIRRNLACLRIRRTPIRMAA